MANLIKNLKKTLEINKSLDEIQEKIKAMTGMMYLPDEKINEYFEKFSIDSVSQSKNSFFYNQGLNQSFDQLQNKFYSYPSQVE